MKNLRILVVDDHERMRKSICGICIDEGHKTEEVSTGAEAIQKLKSKKGAYGLVFMDNRMSGINGIEATAQIRKFDKTTPIYLCSLDKFPEDEVSMVGFNGYIDKGNAHEEIPRILRENSGG